MFESKPMSPPEDGLFLTCPSHSVALQGLRPIRLPQLQVGRVHHGRVLYGTLCADPFKISGIMTLLEDEQGFAVRIAIYNVAYSDSTPAALQRLFPNGAKVAIKDPYFKQAMDGSLAIRIENPAKVERLTEFPAAQQQHRDVDTVDLEEERQRGNRCFRNQDWNGAAAHYTKCINSALAKENDAAAKAMLLLAYSNRAETWLQTDEFERALQDSNKGLEIDPRHVKTLYRKARALQGIKNYADAYEVLRKASTCCPESADIDAVLRQAKALQAQNRQGSYDISDFLLGGPPPEELDDFVGDMEIKMTKDGRGRGLYATRNLNTGDLLLVSNAVAVARRDGGVAVLKIEHWNKINMTLQEDLVAAVVDAARKSQKLLRQLYALDNQSPEVIAQVPAMELFEIGGRQETLLQVDVNRIRDIIVRNSFGDGVQTFATKTKVEAQALASNEDFTGLWLLPSFINHSCLPNAERLHVGNAMFVHACKPIKRDEEITICYFDTLVPLRQREAMCENWGFKCKCKRCTVEQSLDRALKPLSAQFEELHNKALEETNAARSAGETFPTDLPESAEFAEVCEKLEKALAEYPRLKDLEKKWVRSSFVNAYFAGTQSNEFFPKTLEETIPSGDDMMQAIQNTVAGDVRTLVMVARQWEAAKHWLSEANITQYAEMQARDACIRVFGKQKESVIGLLISRYAKCHTF